MTPENHYCSRLSPTPLIIYLGWFGNERWPAGLLRYCKGGMVLEIRLISILMILFCTSCNAGDMQLNITDQAIVDGYELLVTDENKNCQLRVKHKGEDKVFPLKPEPPCYFLRRGGEKQQSVAYKDVEVLNTLIVMGTPLSSDNRKKWDIDGEMICGELAQGVLIKNEQVTVTDKILEGGVFCRDTGSDEKNFWYLAH